jgi:hypothetical protein
MDYLNKVLKYIIISLFVLSLLNYYPNPIVMNNDDMYIIAMSVGIFYAIIDRIFPSITYKKDK